MARMSRSTCLGVRLKESKVVIAASIEPVFWVEGSIYMGLVGLCHFLRYCGENSPSVLEAEEREKKWQGSLALRAPSYSGVC